MEIYSSRLLPCVEWKPAPHGNANVINDTADFYRFFNARLHAELCQCAQRTVEQDLPKEIQFRQGSDTTSRAGAESMIDIPERPLKQPA